MYQLLTDKKQHWVTQNLGVDLPEQPYPAEAYPGYAAPIVLLDDQSNVKCTLARFGLVPHWAKDANIGRRTYNARTETVGEKPSYRTPWRKRQFAIALLDDFFEPCWETGRAGRCAGVFDVQMENQWGWPASGTAGPSPVQGSRDVFLDAHGQRGWAPSDGEVSPTG